MKPNSSLCLAFGLLFATASASGLEAVDVQKTIDEAELSLPAGIAGNSPFFGKLSELPKIDGTSRLPVVVFLHGSSGFGDATRIFQKWLANDVGVASFAPNSMVFPNRIMYKSPVSKEIYEQVHALRAAELKAAIDYLSRQPWVDRTRLMIAGTSEAAVSIARYDGPAVAARMIFAWSCETNYFVNRDNTAIPGNQAVLNVISASDPYFSPNNPWNAGYAVKGHCGEALKDHKNAEIVLIPGAPHTLLNLKQTQGATKAFIAGVIKAD